LGHALLKVVFGLLLLLENSVVIDLLKRFPVGVHLFLYIQNKRVLKPNALVIFVFYQGVADIVASYSAQERLDVHFVDA